MKRMCVEQKRLRASSGFLAAPFLNISDSYNSLEVANRRGSMWVQECEVKSFRSPALRWAWLRAELECLATQCGSRTDPIAAPPHWPSIP